MVGAGKPGGFLPDGQKLVTALVRQHPHDRMDGGVEHQIRTVDFQPVKGWLFRWQKAIGVDCLDLESVFSQPQTDAARKLIFRGAGKAESLMGKRMVRIVFDGETFNEPIIAQLVMQCHVAVNIFYADTRDVGGKVFGQMILQLPEDRLQQDKVLYFLKNRNLKLEEVDGHAL